MEKPRYINNKELLAEIHRSKVTFCSFVSPEYSDFDLIVSDLALITDEAITKAHTKRATKKLEAREWLVVRLMTNEHVPIDPDRKRKGKDDIGKAKTTFPPFKHYRRDADGTLTEVGRSHWEGGLQNGHFIAHKGKISTRLAHMFMLLVERYSRRGNWRGYCVDEQTEALTTRGWVSGSEINETDTILSYKDGKLCWSSIKSIYRDHYEGKMFHLSVRGMDALVTPGHRFVTDDGLKPVEQLLEKDRVIMMGSAVSGPAQAVYSDSFVELVGWVVTEGSVYLRPERRYPRIDIYQNEGPKAERIRTCMRALDESYGEGNSKTCLRFNLRKALCLKIAEVIDVESKAPRMDFLLSLTPHQRLLLLETMIDGDGHRHEGKMRYSQRCQKQVAAFVALCTLSGLRTSTKQRDIVSYGKETSINTITVLSDRYSAAKVENIDFHGGKRSGDIKGRGKHLHPNEPTVPFSGTVWCPVTEYGCFIARRNGTVFLTGNSYVDEMRSHALLQLSQIGLQFDESKSDNPFAFYTTAIKNCFTRVLNLERRNQNIRDEMLMMAGASPSYTKQVEHEMEWAQKRMQPLTTEVKVVPKGRPGRRKKVTTPTDDA